MFGDARLTALYDLINPHLEDTAFYLELARDVGAADVVDLGCGTGRLALALSARGHSVTAVDPSPQMLDVARSKPGATSVRWIKGGAEQLRGLQADLVVMTGHVAQFFLLDTDWLDALSCVRDALRYGGRLAFETRNPVSQPWEMWTRDLSYRVTDLASGRLETWYQIVKVHD